jgi:hypothetical protein
MLAYLAERYPSTTSMNKTNPWSCASEVRTNVIDDKDVVAWLAARGFPLLDLNEQRKSGLPQGAAIHVAAYEGEIRVCRWLAALGAQLSLKAERTGMTPMHCAMMGGSYNACVFLYKNGCHVDLAKRATNGKLPADYATESGHARCIQWAKNVQRENWLPDAPDVLAQLISELALYPPPRRASENYSETPGEKETR